QVLGVFGPTRVSPPDPPWRLTGMFAARPCTAKVAPFLPPATFSDVKPPEFEIPTITVTGVVSGGARLTIVVRVRPVGLIVYTVDGLTLLWSLTFTVRTLLTPLMSRWPTGRSNPGTGTTKLSRLCAVGLRLTVPRPAAVFSRVVSVAPRPTTL